MATSEGFYQLTRAAGRGNKQMTGTIAITGQGTATVYLHNFQAAILSAEMTSAVYENAKITSKTAPSLIINVTTSAAVSTTARTVDFHIFGNME